MTADKKFEGTVVLGAGLSGLGSARALPGARVFEANNHPAGHCYSHDLDGVLFDEGAHICHSRDRAWLDMIYKAAGDVELIDASSVANYWKGHWCGYPVQNNLADLPKEVALQAMKGIVESQSDFSIPANYYDWCRSQYGEFLTEKFYRLYTNKYWRVAMEELSTDWLGGRLLPSQIERIVDGAFGTPQDSQAVFAKFHYPARGGFFSFFKSLYDGLDIDYNSCAKEVGLKKRKVIFADGRVEKFDRLISSIALPDLVKMIPEAPEGVREAASKLRHLQLLCVNIIVNKSDLSKHHWFYIYDEEVDVSRVKVMSNVAPAASRDGTTALQCEIFRRMDEYMPLEALTDKAVQDMGRLLGFEPSDVHAVASVPVSHSYVISDLNRDAATNIIIAWLEENSIYPVGLLGRWKFIWSDAAYLSGAMTAVKFW